jgi:hypothetical protein
VKLVRDIEDRTARGGKLAQCFKQLRHLLRGEHRGWLVHDKQAGFEQQRPHDLDALALAHRQRGDHPVRIKFQAVLVEHLADADLEFRGGNGAVHAQRDVFQNGKRFEQ